MTTKSTIDFRLGDWQRVLRDDFDDDRCLSCDAVVTDPPFGERIHESKPTRRDAMETSRGKPLSESTKGSYSIEGLTPNYEAWSRDHVFEFVRSWSPVCRGWIATMTSHDLIPHWEDAYTEVGRFCFAPIPIVMPGMSVRLAGDGPSSWSVMLIVARPRSPEFVKWGTLRGAYIGPTERERKSGRGKPRWLLREIIADYSREGDLVIDPMAGWGSTLLAAESLGRRAIGCDGHEPTYQKAIAEIARVMPG